MPLFQRLWNLTEDCEGPPLVVKAGKPRTNWYNLDLAFSAFFFTEYSHVAAFTHLQAGALVRKRRAEESRYDAHDRLSHVTLQNGVGVLALARAVAHLQSSGQLNSEPVFFWGVLGEEGRDNAYPADVDQEVLKEFPHVVGGVDLFHLHLRVNIAVVQEVDVSDLHLKCWDLVEHRLSVRVSSRLCPSGISPREYSPRASPPARCHLGVTGSCT